MNDCLYMIYWERQSVIFCYYDKNTWEEKILEKEYILAYDFRDFNT